MPAPVDPQDSSAPPTPRVRSRLATGLVRLPPALHSLCDGLLLAPLTLGGVIAGGYAISFLSEPLLGVLGRDRVQSLPAPIRVLGGLVYFVAPLVGGGFLGRFTGRLAAGFLLAARCPFCDGRSAQQPRELWGLRYRCSGCGAEHQAPSPGPWIVASACALLGSALVVLPFLPISRTSSLEVGSSTFLVWLGLLLLQVGIFAAGWFPRILARIEGLKGADMTMFPIGFMLFQMVVVTMIVMLNDAPKSFPMGRSVALAGMSTFLCAALFIMLGSFPPSAVRDRWNLVLVTLLVTFFGMAVAAVAFGGALIFAPGAWMLMGLAGWLWWRTISAFRSRKRQDSSRH